MFLRNRLTNPRIVITIGLIFLIIANAGSYLLRRTAYFSESVSDGAGGFLFGLAIASLLLGIWMNARQLRSATAPACPWWSRK